MCKALSQGGKRCPIHRHDVKAFLSQQIKEIQQKSLFNFPINETIAEELFSSLRAKAYGLNDIADYSKYVKIIGKNNALSEEDYNKDPVNDKILYAIEGFYAVFTSSLENAYDKLNNYGYEEEYLKVNLLLGERINLFNEILKDNESAEKNFLESDRNAANKFYNRLDYALEKTIQESQNRLDYGIIGSYKPLYSSGDTHVVFNKSANQYLFYSKDPNENYKSNIIGTVEGRNFFTSLLIKKEIKQIFKQSDMNSKLKVNRDMLRLIARKYSTEFSTNNNDYRIQDEDLDTETGLVHLQKRRCKYCGQFISLDSYNHNCPEGAIKRISTMTNNKDLSTLIESDNLEFLKTDAPFTVFSNDLGVRPDSNHSELRLRDKENNDLAFISLKEYYIVPSLESNILETFTFKPVEDKELASRIVDFNYVSEMIEDIEEKKNHHQIPVYIFQNNQDVISQIPDFAKLHQEMKDDDFAKITLSKMSNKFHGYLILEKNNNDELSYSLDYIRGATCRECSHHRYSDYCNHKAELRIKLDELLETSKTEKIKTADQIISSFIGTEDKVVERNDIGEAVINLNSFNSKTLKVDSADLKYTAIQTFVKNNGIKDINNLNEKELDNLVDLINFTDSFKQATCREPKKFLRSNSEFLTENNVIIVNKFNFPLEIKDEKFNLSYEVSTSNLQDRNSSSLRSVKCDCSEYLENYRCIHIQFLKPSKRTVIEDDNDSDEIAMHIFENFMNSNLFIDKNKNEIKSILKEEIKSFAELEESRDDSLKYKNTINSIEKSYNKNDPYNSVRESQKYLASLSKKIEEEKKNSIQYTEDMDSFYTHYKTGRLKKRKNEKAIELEYENATNGICAPVKGAKKFGLEIEVVHGKNLTEDQKETAVKGLIKDFKNAGLIPNDQNNVGGYKHNAAEGYKTWSIESDSTVDLEIVSPPLYDAPECWNQLETATRLLKKHGFEIDSRCGGHVNISTSSYLDAEYENKDLDVNPRINVAKVLELKTTFDEHYEIFRRLGQDTKAGTHRGTQWCAPSFTPFDEVLNGKEASFDYPNPETQYKIFRENGINLSKMAGYNSDYDGEYEVKTMRAEFRIFDGSLEPEIIQQRVKIAAALTLETEVRAIKNNLVINPKPNNIRMLSINSQNENEDEELYNFNTEHYLKEKELLHDKDGRTHTKETLEEDSKKTRIFIDQLFSRNKDKEDAAKLYAITKWSK